MSNSAIVAIATSGYSGYSGTGSSGFSGYSGTGTSGFSGYSGPTGASGFSGYSGPTGTSGFSGYSGPSGFSGYSGPSGFSGYSGPSGFSGYSGRSGFSGYSGTGSSGYSGYSSTGSSGYSGYSGSGSATDTYYLLFTLAATTADPVDVYLKAGDVTMSSTKGIVMNQACTVKGISFQVDITAFSGIVSLEVDVRQNGTTVASLQAALSGTVNDLAAYNNDTQTGSFAAGDVMSVSVRELIAMGGSTTIQNLIVLVEVHN